MQILPGFGPKERTVISQHMLTALEHEKDINVKLVVLGVIPIVGFENQADPAIQKTVNILTNLLQNNSSQHVRYEVLMSLANFGPAASVALSYIASTSLAEPNSWQNRKAAAFALGQIGMMTDIKGPNPTGPNKTAIASLLMPDRGLSDKSHLVCREAVNALIFLGGPTDLQIWTKMQVELKKIINNDTDSDVKLWARAARLRSAREIAKKDDEDIDALIRFLGDATEAAKATRLEVIQLIPYIGLEHTKWLVPVLVDIAAGEKEDIPTRLAAISTLAFMKINSGAILPTLDKINAQADKDIKRLTDEGDEAERVLLALPKTDKEGRKKAFQTAADLATKKREMEALKATAKAAEANLMKKDEPPPAKKDAPKK